MEAERESLSSVMIVNQKTLMQEGMNSDRDRSELSLVIVGL